MPVGNYRGISLKEELFERVERLIKKLGTYRSVSEFVYEAVRIRLEALEKLQMAEGENEEETSK